jgi:hypothetical protein
VPAAPLTVRLAVGDIAAASASVIVVGHLNGLPPAGAEAAIDRALGGAISRRASAGLLDGQFGGSHFLPAARAPLAADAVLVLNLGESGKLDLGRLPELGSAIVDALDTAGAADVATVVHGAGGVGVGAERAARLLLEGMYEGIVRVGPRCALRTVMLVESDERHVAAVRRALSRAQAPAALSVFAPTEAVELGTPAVDAAHAAEEVPPHLRLGITRASDGLKVTVISEAAYDAADLGEYPTVDAARILLDADAIARQPTPRDRLRSMRSIGRTLYERFLGWVDFDIADALRRSRRSCVILRLDESTADLPWELLLLGRSFLCHDATLSRQREVIGAGRPAAYVRPHKELRVLVVANPLGDLDGAAREGRAVAAGLRAAGAKVEELGAGTEHDSVVDAIGSLNPDVLHYAGHASFDPERQAMGGLVLADGVLTAEDLSAAPSLPRLVFANGCNSGQTGSVADQSARDGSAATHDFGGTLLHAGARSFVGSQWIVDDEAGVTFAAAFYESVMAGGEPGGHIGTAVGAGRRAVIEKHGAEQPAWAAYVHYGRPWQAVLDPAVVAD